MKGDKKVIEYLNKALRHELTAVNQYWLHYRLLDNWGYKVLAKTWRKELIEEMQHADNLIQRIIFLDGSPNMQTLESLHIGKTVKAVLDSDLQAELSARFLYAEAATHCHSVTKFFLAGMSPIGTELSARSYQPRDAVAHERPPP